MPELGYKFPRILIQWPSIWGSFRDRNDSFFRESRFVFFNSLWKIVRINGRFARFSVKVGSYFSIV